MIKLAEGLGKRWVEQFTCLSTRAVHLEVLEDLTAVAFVHTLRRFVARRGSPTLIISDNAKQFHAVAKALKAADTQNDEDNQLVYSARKGIKWQNITPRAPWSGGFYERLVGLTKTAMKQSIGRKLLQERELITMVTEVEGILNTRPITYVN